MFRYFLLLFFCLFAIFSGADDRCKHRHVQRPDTFVVQSLSNISEHVKSVENLLYSQDTVFWEQRLRQNLSRLCQGPLSQTSQLGILVVDAQTGKELFSHHARGRMRPASCQKLVTAIGALHFLGANYAIETELRLGGNVGEDRVFRGDIFALGRMDAMLSQGDVFRMAQALFDLGIDSIVGHLVLDLSYREDLPFGWGWCWDDKWGPLSALSVGGKDIFAKEFLADLKSLGVSVESVEVIRGTCPKDAPLLLSVSHTIGDHLERMMKQSDNLYAESVFQQLAAMSGKPYSGRKQAVARLNELVTQLGFNAHDYQFADGSGLSLYNYVSAELLVGLLRYAWLQPSMRGVLMPVLPVASIDGTLKRRMTKTPANGRVLAKTGSLEGVSTLSGYVLREDGRVLIFSIINQGVRNLAQGRNFQDEVCSLLCQ